jgi:hypothetical protein
VVAAVCNLVARASLFFETSPDGAETQYFVFSTDQLDNVDRSGCARISTTATILLVGSAQDRITLGAAQVIRFENIQDALDYVERDASRRST